MDKRMMASASNALVASADFYGNLTRQLLEQVVQEESMTKQIGAQMKELQDRLKSLEVEKTKVTSDLQHMRVVAKEAVESLTLLVNGETINGLDQQLKRLRTLVGMDA